MSNKPEPFDARAADGMVTARQTVYAMLYPIMREVAHQMGYALAIHGTLQRDLDLVAVPWVECPATPDYLATAMARRIGATLSDQVASKPHGRMSFVIFLHDWPPDGPCEHAAGAGYIDLSVVSPREKGHVKKCDKPVEIVHLEQSAPDGLDTWRMTVKPDGSGTIISPVSDRIYFDDITEVVQLMKKVIQRYEQ